MQELPRRLFCGGSDRLLHQPPLCSAGHGDPGEYERWVKRTITSEFVTWDKSGETGLNNYVDHGRPGGDGRTGGEDLQTMSLCSGDLSGWVSQKSRAHRPTMQTNYMGWKVGQRGRKQLQKARPTRLSGGRRLPQPLLCRPKPTSLSSFGRGGDMRGLHLQYKPEPSIDRWRNSEVKFDMEKGGYIKPTGKALNASEKGTFARYQRRHVVRCRAGDLADKLTRMVDKYLPGVATESRVYIMRFAETIPKLLKRVRKIRRKIKATRQGDAKMAVQTSTRRTRQRHEKRGSTTERPVPKPRGITTGQHVTKEHDDEQESIPDWGDDVANDDMDNEEDTPTTTTAAHVAEGDDLATMWPWGDRGRPSDRGESVGVLAQRPNLPTTPKRQSSHRGSTLQQAVQMVQAHMAQQRGEQGRLRQELSRD